MTEIIFYAVILLAGIFLITYRPMARHLQLPIYWEVGSGALLVIFFMFLVTSTYVTPKITEEDLAKKPCGSESPQGACYSLEHSLCEKAWANAETTCKADLAYITKERPSALIGPALNHCRAKKMDQFLHYNRVNTDSSFCKAYFDFIEAK